MTKKPTATIAINILIISTYVEEIVKANNILFMPAMTAPSHVKSMLPLAKALRKDGHSISLAQYYSEQKEKLSEDNVEFIYLSTYGESLMDEKFANSVWRAKTVIPWGNVMTGWAAGEVFNTFIVDYECPKPAKLSKEYLQFVEDPVSKGTIILSFGHFADWKAAPVATIQAVSSAFENLQQYRIIWQFNGDLSVVSNTSHVRIETWVPLAAILQHPKTVLFITHTGIKSFLEAVCFATPVVAVPLFGDQPRYSMLASMHGFGIRLDKTTLTKEALYNTIIAVAENRKYKERIAKFRGMISDRIIDATSNGKFWINFYLRHPSSANRMRLKGTMLNSFTYSCYDVFTLLCILLFSLRSAIDS
ncbi:UDPGT domain containing protein [Trichuris trichiura]|uniref:UDP-glucuronosyltransferase n=1 Tax=Trichuris trichiura TaxID=36087 RepID=A0A077Z3D9_TRITR|nr:UDPGT domain containing protein [Trichuris trichiura]